MHCKYYIVQTHVHFYPLPTQKKNIKWTFSKYLYRKRTSSGHFQNTYTEKGHQVDIFKIPIQKKDIKWRFLKYLYRKKDIKWTSSLTRPRMQQNIELCCPVTEPIADWTHSKTPSLHKSLLRHQSHLLFLIFTFSSYDIDFMLMYYALFTYTVCAEKDELENCHVERKPFLSITSVSIFINLVDICNFKSLVFLQVLHDFFRRQF